MTFKLREYLLYNNNVNKKIIVSTGWYDFRRDNINLYDTQYMNINFFLLQVINNKVLGMDKKKKKKVERNFIKIASRT